MKTTRTRPANRGFPPGDRWDCLFDRARAWFAAILAALLAGCGTSPISPADVGGAAIVAKNAVVSATFGPGGRLWRVIPTDEYVYVDFSDDRGATFSAPVAVNNEPQRVQARPEDRPEIAVDDGGRVYVTYSADAQQPWTSFFSYSSDGGEHFTPPIAISDHAAQAKHYQSTMLVQGSGRVHLFWNDERGATSYGGASLYHAATDNPADRPPTNQKIKDAMCECCRLAAALNRDGMPVVFARFLLPGNIRDHGIVDLTSKTPRHWRVTDDDWLIEACPEHGPALAIAENGRYHVTWFTQGRRRQGLFYAYSDDRGQRFSTPMAFGDNAAMSGHADVIAAAGRVVVAWQEFDGEKISIQVMTSNDSGAGFSPPKTLAQSGSAADYPFLLNDGQRIFLSWNARDQGYRLIPIP